MQRQITENYAKILSKVEPLSIVLKASVSVFLEKLWKSFNLYTDKSNPGKFFQICWIP